MKRSERANESQRGVAGLVDDANVRGPVIALRLHNAIDLADNEFDVCCITPPVYPDTQVGANRAKQFRRSNSWADKNGARRL